MMNEVTLVIKSYQLIRKDLGLEPEVEIGEENGSFGWLEKYLEDQIDYLLDHDFNRLINALYRIDIPEYKVNELLYSSDTGQLSKNIAITIIEREKQKVLIRFKYQS